MTRIFHLLSFFVLVLLISCHTQQKTSELLFPIIYFDLDGTLLDSNKEIRPRVLKAIDQFKQHGGKVSIATGRSYIQAKPYFEIIKPNLPIILADGALAIEPENEKVIQSKTLSQNTLDQLQEFSQTLSGITGIYFYYKKEIHRLIKTETARDFSNAYFMTNTSECSSFEECLKIDSSENPLKIIFLFEKQFQTQANNTLTAKLFNDIDLYVSPKEWPYIEVSPKGTDKSTTIQALMKETGHSINDIVYFGDAGNDTKMLATVPMGIAMTGCHPDSCKAATFMTGSNDSDAIADIIERLLITR